MFAVLLSHGALLYKEFNNVIVSFYADMMMSLLSINLFIISIIGLTMITYVLTLFLVPVNNGSINDMRLNISCPPVCLSPYLFLLLA